MARLFQGLKVVEAKTPLKIFVGLEDISAAKRKKPRMCAVAMACRRLLHTDVRIHLTRSFILRGDHWVRYQTPKYLRTELISFDRGGTFAPGAYVLPPVPESEQRQKRTGPKLTEGKPRRVYRAVVGVRPAA